MGVTVPTAESAAQPPALPIVVGTPTDERARIAHLVSGRDDAATLLRSASSMPDTLPAPPGGRKPAGAPQRGIRSAAIWPSLHVVWNSELPFSLNDGAMWAGRGTSGLVRGGGVFERGRVRVVLLPELVFAENRPFEIRPSSNPTRSPYASPWYDGRSSADLPSRFGDERSVIASLGQSSITVAAGPVAVGFATENEWWGPGMRSALVMSDNAGGVPHAFVRTLRPVRTGIGTIEARYLVGTLTPSLFFDSTSVDYRAISAGAVTLRPAFAPRLTIGLTRSATAAIDGPGESAFHVFDALFAGWGASRADAVDVPAADALLSLFARYALPFDGVEVYAEWARQSMPETLSELFGAPQDGQGYTLGLQVVRPLRPKGYVLRVQTELSDVEQSRAFRDRPPPRPFYTGRATRGGYTQRGQVIGAATGPGSSTQWFATDMLSPRVDAGLFVGRIRWDNEALYAQPGANFFRHDVSTFLGARAATRLPDVEVGFEAYWGRRYNYLFQNNIASAGTRTVDVTNLTFALTVTPR